MTLNRDFDQPVQISLRVNRESQFVTRFAPSPTGHLHLGHVASAIYVWGIAKSVDARIILRIEDHDQQRSKYKHEIAILTELAALGFTPDQGPRIEAPGLINYAEYRQSNHDERFAKVLQSLLPSQTLYQCTCTRKNMISLMPAGDYPELVYRNICRDKLLNSPTLCKITKMNPKDQPWGIRLKLPPTKVSFIDGLLGPQHQHPESQCGDLLLKDKKCNWTYHFASVVDDVYEGINLVIRGEDILPSTGRQKLLMDAIGTDAHPSYIHHPLIIQPGGTEKLSKRLYSESISDLLAQGKSPSKILGLAAHAVGLTPHTGELDIATIDQLFSVNIIINRK